MGTQVISKSQLLLKINPRLLSSLNMECMHLESAVQRIMNVVFKEFVREFLEIFMDDLFVHLGWNDHLDYLEKVLRSVGPTASL